MNTVLLWAVLERGGVFGRGGAWHVLDGDRPADEAPASAEQQQAPRANNLRTHKMFSQTTTLGFRDGSARIGRGEMLRTVRQRFPQQSVMKSR